MMTSLTINLRIPKKVRPVRIFNLSDGTNNLRRAKCQQQSQAPERLSTARERAMGLTTGDIISRAWVEESGNCRSRRRLATALCEDPLARPQETIEVFTRDHTPSPRSR